MRRRAARCTSCLGLAYIEPELREDRGELEAARVSGARGAGRAHQQEGLPELIELGDIRGDLHSHTVASDGHNTIEEMALAARERGYEYLAITDHSASHGFGNDGLPRAAASARSSSCARPTRGSRGSSCSRAAR